MGILTEGQYNEVAKRAQKIYGANRGNITRDDAMVRALESLEDFIDDISEEEYDDIKACIL